MERLEVLVSGSTQSTQNERREIEVKIPVSAGELDEVRVRLQERGFQVVQEPQAEENLLFDFPDGRLAERGCALRLRQVGVRAWLTFKGPQVRDSTLKIREERESPVGDPGEVVAILRGIGLQPVFSYEKTREILEGQAGGDKIEACLDVTPLGCFVELEGAPEAIRKLAGSLGWSPERFVTESYVSLYLRAGLGRSWRKPGGSETKER